MPEATTPIVESYLPLGEFVQRRERVQRALKGAVGLVFAGGGAAPHRAEWLPDLNFYYLTGMRHEAEACVLFDGGNPDPRRRCVLFLRPVDTEADAWHGFREPISASLRESTGFETVMRMGSLPTMLGIAAGRAKRLACLHPFSTHTAPVSPDLEVFQKLAQRMPGTAIEDRSTLITSMRLVKSAAELKLMRRAAEITAAGYAALMAELKPGMTERVAQQVLESAYVEHGAHRVAYSSIVAGGPRACVLHYTNNDRALNEGDLLLIDSGAEYGGYAADVTRVLPVSGRFTDRQREVYDLVLRAQRAAIKRTGPGVAMFDIDAAARDIITAAGHGDAFNHGIGHHLGLSVHDPRSEAPLEPGAVITIEPGVYLTGEGIGVRIEDDVLVTAKGFRVLTDQIPKDADDIEAAMRHRGAGRGR